MRSVASRISVLVTALGLIALAGCSGAAPVAPPDASPPATGAPSPTAPAATATPLDLAPQAPVGAPADMASGLSVPWDVVFTGQGTPLVSERETGNILELLGDGTSRLVGTVAGVEATGEGGLLGLALDDEGRLYVYSTAASGNRIERYALHGAAGALSLGAAESIVSGLPAARNHNGGRIAFGPDGMLYAGVGDAGDVSLAQRPDSLGGKILRMTSDGAVPPDNPFPGSLVYSLGHRNVQGLGWAANGVMFASEFGQDTWDELNIVSPGGNYGWPEVEGAAGDPRYADPVQQWRTDDASPSGLAVAGGTVFVANLRGERLRGIPVADPGAAAEYYAGEYGRLRTAVLAPDGALWLVTNNTDGRGAARPGDDRILRAELGR
jgi:glucose/arabinose dehydrogenase